MMEFKSDCDILLGVFLLYSDNDNKCTSMSGGYYIYNVCFNNSVDDFISFGYDSRRFFTPYELERLKRYI